MKRHFARTNFNGTSSRSHTVFGTNLECFQTYADSTTIIRRGELKLVDFAGNERVIASEGIGGAKVIEERRKALPHPSSVTLFVRIIARRNIESE